MLFLQSYYKNNCFFLTITPYTLSHSLHLALLSNYYLLIESVPESCFQDIEGFVAQDEPKRRVVGAKNPTAVVEARCQRLYKRQLEGLTARQLVLDHASRESISVPTAWRDWKAVNAWNEEDWQKDRENMLSRLQSMRIKLFNQAMKKGQLQTAAQVLDSLGRVIGESVETVNIQAPELAIKVEAKN